MGKKLNIWFDRKGDFLELTTGKPVKGFFKEIGNDMLERVDAKTGKVIGLSILNFSKRFDKLKETKRLELPLGIELKSL
mgnify:CR=1 FL=1